MKVLDASAVVAALTRHGPDAAPTRRRVFGGDEVRAPHLMPAEVMSALRRLVDRKQLARRAATTGFRKLSQLRFRPAPFLPFAPLIWEWRHNLSVYDAWYVALAHKLEVPLLTADRRLARAAAGLCETELLQ